MERDQQEVTGMEMSACCGPGLGAVHSFIWSPSSTMRYKNDCCPYFTDERAQAWRVK